MKCLDYRWGLVVVIKVRSLCGRVQVSARLEVRAASQLVSGNWPQLQVLMVAFLALDEQVVHTLTTGKWPMLKELHVDLRPYPT